MISITHKHLTFSKSKASLARPEALKKIEKFCELQG
jgi:hypothetical protein